VSVLALTSAQQALAAPLHAQVDRVLPWTTDLRDRQPDRPRAMIYNRAGRRLIFVAVEHGNTTGSATFDLIDKSLRLWPIRSIIIEGTSASLGADPPELRTIANKRSPGAYDPDGETGPAARTARAIGARLYGGEADDLAVRAAVRRAGISDVDLLGFFVLRVIPQWARDRSISAPDDSRLERLVDDELGRSRAALALPSSSMPDFEAFSDWYQRMNGKPLKNGVEQEEAGPLADGRWATNRVGAAVSRARDEHLLRQIAERLNKDGSIAVVFGGSHAVIVKPALDTMLGPPCYVGEDMLAAAGRCSRASIRSIRQSN
jgi:hypothetical protein